MSSKEMEIPTRFATRTSLRSDSSSSSSSSSTCSLPSISTPATTPLHRSAGVSGAAAGEVGDSSLSVSEL
ncbi:hypothetical protein CaCOL14_003051 [Colletotrichum acutatum]